MPSGWGSSATEARGAYTAVAQTEELTAELTPHGTVNDASLNTDNEDDKKAFARQTSPTLDDGEPTPEDFATLPRVADRLPWGAFLVAIVELCERFAYYGLSGPFQNYMANKYQDPSGLPGAIGLAQSGATALSNSFQFWCYVTPILGAIVADQYLGKYLAIKYFSVVYMVGMFILFVTSLPYSIERGGAFPGLIAAMVIIGVGTGGIKANVSPLIAEQVQTSKPFVKHLPGGKRIIVDPAVTVQRVYMIFYMCINIGSISAIATTTLELRVGFWSAYLLPLFMFGVGFFVLLSGKDKYVIKPPQGGVISNCFKALWIASRNRFDLDTAKPSLQERGSLESNLPWDDKFIDELKTALAACKAFLFFPIYWVSFSQMLNNFVSQAGQMQLHGLPNDILPNVDPLTLIIMIPLMDRFIYPFIRTRLHLAFTPTTRITWGFFIAASAMVYAAVLQSRIYASGPCYNHPLRCDAGKISEGKYKPNEVHVAWQTPAYILIALSEILAIITGLELAYAKAPENMKSFIMSLFLLTSAGGSAMGIVIAPIAKDPHLVWLYAGLACAAGIAGGLFLWTFRESEAMDPRPVQSADEGISLARWKSGDEGVQYDRAGSCDIAT